MADDGGVVLDTAALLAMLRDEPGGELVRAALRSAVISSVNLGETLVKLMRRGVTADRAVADLQRLKLPVVPWTESLVWESRDLCPLAWSHGLSFADRACLGTARALGRIALTADAQWPEAVRRLKASVRVQLIRERPPRGR